MAESEGFEPPVPFRVRLISSQVHSTGLCQLSVVLPAYYFSKFNIAYAKEPEGFARPLRSLRQTRARRQRSLPRGPLSRRGKWRSRQPRAVVQMALRAVGPPISRRNRHGHCRTAQHHRASIDLRLSRRELSIFSRYFKPCESAAFGFESRRMIEPNPQAAAFRCYLAIERP
jgi:hypothetical protein